MGCQGKRSVTALGRLLTDSHHQSCHSSVKLRVAIRSMGRLDEIASDAVSSRVGRARQLFVARQTRLHGVEFCAYQPERVAADQEVLRRLRHVHQNIWLPGEGREILLPVRRILPPTPYEGIVVNLPEHRLYFYPKPRQGGKRLVVTCPVSIGRMDWRSPLGQTRVIAKERNPNWYPPDSIRKEHAARGDPLPKVVPPGPKNPLGEYKMRLAVGDGTYEIHGTNNSVAVGLAVTHGCIRMYSEDVAALFASIAVGTKVWLITEPVKIAYVDGKLLMEVHPPVDGEGQTAEVDLEMMSQKLRRALGQDSGAIHWDFARKALEAATGVPTVVGLRVHLDQASASNDP